jgi:hypothetical protein
MRLTPEQIATNKATFRTAMAESDLQAGIAADIFNAGQNDPGEVARATFVMVSSIRQELIALSAQLANQV